MILDFMRTLTDALQDAAWRIEELKADLEAARDRADSLYARTVNPRRNTGRALTAIAEGRVVEAVDLLADAHDDLRSIGSAYGSGTVLTCGEVGSMVAARAAAAARTLDAERAGRERAARQRDELRTALGAINRVLTTLSGDELPRGEAPKRAARDIARAALVPPTTGQER